MAIGMPLTPSLNGTPHRCYTLPPFIPARLLTLDLTILQWLHAHTHDTHTHPSVYVRSHRYHLLSGYCRLIGDGRGGGKGGGGGSRQDGFLFRASPTTSIYLCRSIKQWDTSSGHLIGTQAEEQESNTPSLPKQDCSTILYTMIIQQRTMPHTLQMRKEL